MKLTVYVVTLGDGGLRGVFLLKERAELEAFQCNEILQKNSARVVAFQLEGSGYDS